MSNLNSLKKSIEELKAKQGGNKNYMIAIDVQNKYFAGTLSYTEAMETLNTQDYPFADMVRVVIQSDHYNDEEKREMLKKE